MARLKSQPCNWFRRPALPLLAVLAAMMVGCAGDESEPIPVASQTVPATPMPDQVDASKTNSVVAGNGNKAFLEWDAVNHPNLRGYRVYYGPDKGMYLQLPGRGIDVGNVTTYTVNGLASRRRYYFAVTAYDKWYVESDYSNEVFKDIR